MARPARIRGDDYADLVDVFEDGGLEPQPRRGGRVGFGDIRREFTVDLGPWDRMVGAMLEQLAEDAGNAGRGLALLAVPTPGLISAWLVGPREGTLASVQWLAESSQYIAPTRPVRRRRSRRGETYDDLAEWAYSFRARGDGRLDGARLRTRYTIRLRRSWLRMAADLLAAVVADAGGLGRAATRLEIGEATLGRWVCYLVSRGSGDASRSTWPLDQGHTREPYVDLCEAIERGGLAGDSELDPPRLRELYCVRLDRWEVMTGELLSQIVVDAGSGRNAARVLDLPRSTLGRRMRRLRAGVKP